jgi:hypothetical protein
MGLSDLLNVRYLVKPTKIVTLYREILVVTSYVERYCLSPKKKYNYGIKSINQT